MKTVLFKKLRGLIPPAADLRFDVVAGLTFAIVNVPQAMGHAMLAAVNPVLGIYTLMVAVPVGALFTSSVLMNVSSTAALSVAAGAALSALPDEQRLSGLAVLVLLAGAIQMLAGILRLGFIVKFISNAVMIGFLNGIAALIILGQLGHLTGFRSERVNIVASALDLFLKLNQLDPPTTIIGVFTLALMGVLMATALRRFAFVLAVAAATLLLALLSGSAWGAVSDWSGVMRVGDIAAIPRELPGLTLPPPGLWLPLLLPAFSLAVIGLIQGAGVSQGYANPDGKYPVVSRDFLGQGVANLAVGLVGGIPAGGSISGTALIMSAGARSRWTNITAGIWVALIVMLAGPLAELVPMPALAALLVVAGYQGLRIKQAATVWNTGKIPAAGMIGTFAATLFLPLQYAVLLGIVLSILLHAVRQSNKVRLIELLLVPGGWPEEHPAPRELPSNRLTLLHIHGSLFFAAARTVEEMLPHTDNARNSVVAIILRGREEIGSTFISVLQRYSEGLKSRENKLMLVGVEPKLNEQLARTGLLKSIGQENVFLAAPQIGVAINRATAAAYTWLGHENTDAQIFDPPLRPLI